MALLAQAFIASRGKLDLALRVGGENDGQSVNLRRLIPQTAGLQDRVGGIECPLLEGAFVLRSLLTNRHLLLHSDGGLASEAREFCFERTTAMLQFVATFGKPRSHVPVEFDHLLHLLDDFLNRE
jgi:hypothetical protein